MDLQDVNSYLQGSSALLHKSDVKNFILGQMYQMTLSEAKSVVDHQGDGKVDTASAHSVKKDLNFTSIVSPMTSSMRGNSNDFINVAAYSILTL